MLHNNGLVICSKQARAIDAAAISELGLSGLLLMENASRGVCEVLDRELRMTNPISVFRSYLEEQVREMTQERHRILFEIVKATRVFQIENIVETFQLPQVGGSSISRATVYRTIHALARAGLLKMRADELSAELSFGRAVIVSGQGNNGGDGIALARHCHSLGLPAKLMLVDGGKQLTGDAAANLQLLTRAGGSIGELTLDKQVRDLQNLEADDIIVDCLLGTGIKGAPREPFRSVIAAINQSPARVLAVDVPSGLDCDTGIAAGDCVEADRTVTFVGMKRGFLNANAAKFTGDVTTAHIGIPLAWLLNWLRENPSA